MPHHRCVPTELGSGVTVAVPLVGELKSHMNVGTGGGGGGGAVGDDVGGAVDDRHSVYPEDTTDWSVSHDMTSPAST
jgi:hypothetical protein